MIMTPGEEEALGKEFQVSKTVVDQGEGKVMKD
jgi:hypothetical protein